MINRTAATVRDLANKARAPGVVGTIANFADLPPEARDILLEFATQPVPDAVPMGTSTPTNAAIVVRKLLCGQHVVAFAAWIEA